MDGWMHTRTGEGAAGCSSLPQGTLCCCSLVGLRCICQASRLWPCSIVGTFVLIDNEIGFTALLAPMCLGSRLGGGANVNCVAIWEPIPRKSSVLQWAVPVPCTECSQHENSSG
eukprot:354064-Chlamydomonas_euryale.AAC.17